MDFIPICTAKEMQTIDRRSIDGDIDRGFAFMQQASRSLLDMVIQDSKNFESVTYYVLAGKGNNGGDGILLASYLLDQGYTVFTFIFTNAEELKGEAALAYEELQNRDPQSTHHRFISDEEGLKFCLQMFEQSSGVIYILDALLGIGAKGAPTGFIATVIRLIVEVIQVNRAHTRVVAVDAPSGVDSTTAEVFDPAIPADITISIGFPKLGCYFYPGKAFFSNTIIKGLDYDAEVVKSSLQEGLLFPTINSFKKAMPRRMINGSKFDHGVVVNCSGSVGMTGAAVLSSSAAYVAGAGLVKVITEMEAYKVIAPSLLEAVYLPFENERDALKVAKSIIESKHYVLSIGSGLSTKHKELVEYFLHHAKVPIILDADGINSFAAHPKDLKAHMAEILLTPHRGEYLRLFPDDFNNESTPLDIIHAVKRRSAELNATILFKGNPTFIADPKGHVFLSPFGNSALATAGSGDILTGLIAGLAAQIFARAQNHNPDISILTQAAILGAYIHARAGELASVQLTEYCVTASDLIDYIPEVFREILNS